MASQSPTSSLGSLSEISSLLFFFRSRALSPRPLSLSLAFFARSLDRGNAGGRFFLSGPVAGSLFPHFSPPALEGPKPCLRIFSDLTLFLRAGPSPYSCIQPVKSNLTSPNRSLFPVRTSGPRPPPMHEFRPPRSLSHGDLPESTPRSIDRLFAYPFTRVAVLHPLFFRDFLIPEERYGYSPLAPAQRSGSGRLSPFLPPPPFSRDQPEPSRRTPSPFPPIIFFPKACLDLTDALRKNDPGSLNSLVLLPFSSRRTRRGPRSVHRFPSFGHRPPGRSGSTSEPLVPPQPSIRSPPPLSTDVSPPCQPLLISDLPTHATL